MTSNEQTDQVLRVLAQLSAPSTSATRNEQVRSRCHAAMARRDVPPTRGCPGRTPLARVLDVALIGAVCFYAAATLVEAIRFVGLQ
jgi:hypothetical protein